MKVLENFCFYTNESCEKFYNAELGVSEFDASNLVKICVVTEGKGFRRILGDIDECRAGDMYIIASGVPHGFFAESPQVFPTVCTVAFNPALALTDEYADPESESFCYGVFRDNAPYSYAMLNSEAMGEFAAISGTIASETGARQLEWQSALRANLVLLLIALGRYINLADTAKQTHPKEWSTVSAAMRAVTNNCGDCNMTLESIANLLFMSKSHLSRMFTKVTGSSFADYVRNIRMSIACNLLRSTTLTNQEIIKRCGLRDVNTFYRIFKTYIGVTPYQYRMSSRVCKGEKIMSIHLEISEKLQKGRAPEVKALVEQAVSEGISPAQILNDGLLAGMNIIGEKFKRNEAYVPEVLVAARAMNVGMQVLKPLLVEDGVQSSGKVCIGAVQGDLHDIGKNLVKMMMEGKGLEVIDLGTDVSPETFVNTAIEQNCQVICCSALLTTTMDVMAQVVAKAEEAGIRDKVKIMIGGAPVTQEFCDKIGADCYTSDATSAAEAAVEFCG